MNPDKPKPKQEMANLSFEEVKESPTHLDVKAILDLEDNAKEALQQTIVTELEQKLSKHIIPNDELNNFAKQLKEKYVHDEQALAKIDERLAILLKPEDVKFCNEHGINVLESKFIGFKTKNQAKALYNIASFLKGRPLDQTETIADVRENLQGKRVLVLGDDTGSLSELLRHYGAESYGIENDEFKLLIARSGLLSLNGQPQEQVIEGSIGDFFEKSTTPLLERLKGLGPFDMIVSDYVFNHGSGIQELPTVRAIDKAAKQLAGFSGTIYASKIEETTHMSAEKKETVQIYIALTNNFRENCDRLLSNNGLQLHLTVDMEYLFDIRHNESPDHWTMIVPKNPQHRKRPKYYSIV